MRIPNNSIPPTLAKRLMKGYDRNLTGCDHIPPRVSTSNAGELIGVTNKNDVRRWPDSLEQSMEQFEVHHRSLVNY